jgi:hypothetical protein
MKTVKKKCIGWTSRREFRNNLPCGNAVAPGSDYCRIHDPKIREAKDAAATARREAEWRQKSDG